MSIKYGVGLVVDVFYDDIEDMLIQYIDNLDGNELENNMDNLLQIVLKEQNVYISKINEFLQDE